MTIIGAIARPNLPPESIRAVALAAEDAGLNELWLWEDCFWEGGIAMSSAVLGLTQRLRVGVGVLPVPLRNVALAAMEVAAVERMFSQRFMFGVGHGIQEWMGQAGVRVRSPLTFTREYVTALRSLLSGDEVTVSGDYVNLRNVRLVHPPLQPPLLRLAATGPKSLALSGEIGDGTILASDTRLDRLPEIVTQIAEGRRSAGRAGESEVTVYVSARRGNAEATVAEIKAWAAAGAHRVVLEPAADETDPQGFIRFVASGIQPMLARGSETPTRGDLATPRG
jgi:alkanesulfonate monooxygenase SsuD/methylene tetrahydromethanopterin reductase-like flavin-dependent oxidoreductase (luciferase family)